MERMSCSPILCLVLSLVLGSSIASAQTTSREALIGRVEKSYLQTRMFPATSPILDRMLGPAMSANPGVSSKQWSDIRKEVASALIAVMMEKGGLLDTLLRNSMANLSDPDLERLAHIVSDPVFQQFRAAMASPSSQKQLMQAIYVNVPKMNMALNGVLVRHGLKAEH